MPNNPNRSQIHIDRALTDISVAYMQDYANFVNEKIFPAIGVAKQSNKYFIYDKGDSLRIHTQVRTGGTESAGAGYDISTGNYYCDPFALHTDISDQDVANTDDPIDLERDGVEFITNDILMKKENDFFAAFFTTGIWDTDRTGVAATPSSVQFLRWDLSGSNPITDVEGFVEIIISKTGVNPKDITLTMAPDVWSVVKNHAEVLDRIKYTEVGIVSESLVAATLGIKQVLVARGVVNTAAKGATAVIGYMATAGGALLTYAPSRPGVKRPSAGYTFNWTGYNKGEATAVYKFRMDHLKADRIEVENAYDQKLVSSDCGLYMTTCITP